MSFTIEIDVELVLYFIAFILCIIILIFVIKNICSNPRNEFSHNNKLPPKTVTLCLLGMIGFILNLSAQIASLIDYGINYDIIGLYSEAFSWLFLFFGVSMGHLLFMDRLFAVFVDATTFRISCKIIKIFNISVSIHLFNWIMFTIINICQIHNKISSKLTEKILIIFLWFGGALNVIIIIFLTLLSTKRLFMLSLSVTDDKTEIQTKQRLYAILDSITKYFILTIVSISVILFITIFGCFWDTLEIIHDEPLATDLRPIYECILPFQALIAVYCYAMNFKFSGTIYLFFCGMLHRCIRDRFDTRAQTRFNTMSKSNDYVLFTQDLQSITYNQSDLSLNL